MSDKGKQIRNSLVLGVLIVGLATYTFQYFPVITGLTLLAWVALLIFIMVDR
jgi:hypothetical protein